MAQIGMSQEELEALAVSFNLPVANRAYGIGDTLGYALAKRGEYPCRVLKIGGQYRVTRADLLRSLGVEATAVA
jgi:hypothetical protein